jgi:hypothetical protein
MRVLPCSVFALLLLFPCVQADDQAAAAKIVDQAIKAVGGEAKSRLGEQLSMKGKATIKEGNQEIQASGELISQGTELYRFDLEVNVMGNQLKALLVLAGDEAWAKMGDQVKDAPKDEIGPIRQAFTVARTVQMLNRLKEKDVKLTPVGEMNVDGKQAVGIKVVQPNRADMDIYFDKTSHLPVKSTCRFKGPKGQEADFEYYFTDWKELGGMKHFGRLAVKFDGMELIDIEVAEVKPLDKVPDGTFAKP